MGTFEDALRERLDAINSIGEAQTTWQKLYNARKREQAAQSQNLAQRQAAWQSQVIQQQNQQNFGSNFSTGGGSAFNQFKNAIGLKESNNNYGARNSQSGAMGKYQIMPSNIKGAGIGWDYEALGYDVSTSQFMKSPQIQEQIANYKLQQYYNKYGPAGAAIAWYAGPGTANKYVNSGQVSRTSEYGGYPSVFAYMQAILRQIGR